MAKKTVLAIGIEPSLVDFSAFPGLTAGLPEVTWRWLWSSAAESARRR